MTVEVGKSTATVSTTNVSPGEANTMGAAELASISQPPAIV